MRDLPWGGLFAGAAPLPMIQCNEHVVATVLSVRSSLGAVGPVKDAAATWFGHPCAFPGSPPGSPTRVGSGGCATLLLGFLRRPSLRRVRCRVLSSARAMTRGVVVLSYGVFRNHTASDVQRISPTNRGVSFSFDFFRGESVTELAIARNNCSNDFGGGFGCQRLRGARNRWSTGSIGYEESPHSRR